MPAVKSNAKRTSSQVAREGSKDHRLAPSPWALICIFLLIGWSSPIAEAQQVIATIPAGNGLIAINPFTNRGVVTNSNGDVKILDLNSNTPLTTISVGGGNFGVALNTTTNQAVTANTADNSASILDLNNNTLLTTIPLGGFPYGVAVNSTTNQALVAMGTSVKVLDLSTRSVLTTISLPTNGHRVAINPATNLAVIAGDGSLPASVINLNTQALVATISLPVGGGNYGLQGIAINPNTNRAVVSLIDSSVVLNLSTNSVASTIPTSSFGYAVAINPTTNQAVVDNFRNNAVQLLDLNTNAILSTIPVGNAPQGVAINPTRSLAYVANTGDGTVSVIDLTVAPPPPPATPHIDSLNPLFGPPGTIVTIAGSNFGGSQGSSTVTFGSTPATNVRSWSTTAIQVVVPSLSPAMVNITVSTSAGTSNISPFQVTALPSLPAISNVVPNSGVARSEITIQGSNFGSSQGSSSVMFGPIPPTVRSWSDTSIRVVVPSLLPSVQAITVTTAAGPSNPASFTIVAAPVITSIDPSQGPTGSDVTIHGSNFQNTPGSLTIGGMPAAASFWANTTIIATVPSGLSPGSKDVIVTTSAGSSAPLLFQVTGAPTIALSTQLIQFSAVPGDAPKQTTFTISNAGSSTLSYSTRVNPFGNWLTITPGAGTAPSTVTVIATVAPLSPGNYQGTITVFGVGATNSGIAVTVNLTVSTTPPPAGTITGLTTTPSPAQVGQSVTITVVGTGPCGGLALAFGDGGSTGVTGSLPLTTTHTYASAGQFTLTATEVNNCMGFASTNLAVNNLTGTLTVTVQRSDTRTPLQGATVTLTQSPSNLSPQITGSDGIATFTNVVAGTYLATATLTGFQTSNATAVVNANTTTPAFILLTPIQSTGTLAVTVRRSDTSAALPGASVALSGGPSSPAPQATGSDGTAIFTNIVIGSYTAMASLAGFRTNSAPGTVVANTTSQVTVALTPSPQQTKRVVILVHGIIGSPASFNQMKILLEDLNATKKFKVFSFDYSAFSFLKSRSDFSVNTPIELIASALKVKCIDNILKNHLGCAKMDDDPKQQPRILDPIDTSSVDIVAHSMGGLVTLAYISGFAAVPYEGDIGKLVTLGTPFFGAPFADLLSTLFSLSRGIFFGKQVDQMARGSEFLWNLGQAWKRSSFRQEKKADVLTVVGTLNFTGVGRDGDGLVPLASASLSDLDIRARYVPKCHFTRDLPVTFPEFDCLHSDAIAFVDSSHPSYKLVRSFLLDGTDPEDCPVFLCEKTPASTTGDLLVRFVEAVSPGIPTPIKVSEFADEEIMTFEPSVGAPGFVHGGPVGTLAVTNMNEGDYRVTVNGSEFFVVTNYSDLQFNTHITRGRTTLLPEIGLVKKVNVPFTVILLTTKTTFRLIGETISLFINMCCRIQSASDIGTSADTQSPVIDGYVWVEIPGGGRFFLMPDFTNFTDVSMPVVTSLPVQDFAGTILNMPIPADLSAGTYTFFAVGVVPGADPFNSANWVTNRAELSVTLTQ